jgi:hypothetical protein
MVFGHRITSLFAPNGSGKTPLIQAIAFCLGYPTAFRENINSNCQAAILELEIDGAEMAFRREFGKDFRISVIQKNGGSREFLSEADFTKALFQTLSLPFPALVSSDRKESHPYVSTLLPIFYVDQDLGYADIYKAPRPFLTDQFVEMIRVSFNLSPKHSYHVKGELLRAKEALNLSDRRIVTQQKVVSDLNSRTDDSDAAKTSLLLRAQQIGTQLANLQGAASIKGGASAALEDIHREKWATVQNLRREIDELSQRISGISGIKEEIQTEIETLGLNEESRRVFVSFEEICRNPECGLFVGSSESYAKNLVYLKDQIKDLERNADRAKVRVEEMSAALKQQESELKSLNEKISSARTDSETGSLIEAIQQLTKESFAVGQGISFVEVLRGERVKLLKLENERNRYLDQIANLTSAGRADLEFNAMRSSLQRLTAKWLDTLHTKNVDRAVSIDLDFKFHFGAEPFHVLKGSTRARVILAVHAAIFELYLEDPERPFRFMVLDTPKQQDMYTGDIAEFLSELGLLCERLNGQLVFSSTEYRHPVGEFDVEWLPTYSGFEQLMYLGPVD